MISPIGIATRGYIKRTPLSVGVRGYLSDAVSDIIYGTGILLANSSIVHGISQRILNAIGNLISSNATIQSVFIGIEIRRMFTVGISTLRTFKNSISAKLKFKVNK